MITNIFPHIFPYKPHFPVELQEKFVDKPKRAYYIYKQKHSCNAPWVVLLHGWLLNSSRMDSRLLYYVEQGFNVLLIDARSHGKSQFVFSSHPLHTVQDAYEIISKEEISTYMIHGVSFGALSALKLATIDYRVFGLVLEAIPYSFDMLMNDLVKNVGILKYISFISVYIIKLLRRDVFKELETSALLKSVFVPSFVIIGEHDPIIRQEQVMAYKHLSKQVPWMKLWIVPGSDHTGMVKHFEYGFRIREFLEDTLYYKDRIMFTQTIQEEHEYNEKKVSFTICP